jgi:hypothetical protein
VFSAVKDDDDGESDFDDDDEDMIEFSGSASRQVQTSPY